MERSNRAEAHDAATRILNLEQELAITKLQLAAVRRELATAHETVQFCVDNMETAIKILEPKGGNV